MAHDHIPYIIFRLNGAEVFRIAAHVLLVVRSFQEGKFLAPEPGTHVEVEINDGQQAWISQFRMPPSDKK